MENRLKLRISRMFHSSFGSCKPRPAAALSDVVESSRLVDQQSRRSFRSDPTEPLLPHKPRRPPPSICRPQENQPAVDDACIVPAKAARDRPRQKLSGRDLRNGRFCPPTSPVSPLVRPFPGGFRDEYYHWHLHPHRGRRGGFEECRKKNVIKKTKSNSKKGSGNATAATCPLSLSSSSLSTYYDGDLFSSDDEREDDGTETLFSSRSLSSDSSESQRHSRLIRRPSSRRRRRRRRATGADVMPLGKNDDGNMKGSFAVVKRSSDPYGDFRTSMVEMIVERQMFSAKDLERLLNCFLSLNSHHHHKIIVQVFTEIYEALFSNWC
ncbi:transcription repressor OFP8-like [Rhodamnia argentea]|uniref:Transcription repressor n=1 Tax=Rhodamnia argentea TaxID=178133 RepID=A0A8B8P5X5_9MYRT|nr:transcription repressor OFP8-like [Rhodamnia argentea]